MKPTKLCLPISLGILGTVLLAATAQAGFVQFSATGTSGGAPVSSKATFQTSPGELTLTLENTTPHTADANQLLTGIRFTLAPSPMTMALWLSAMATPRIVADDGTYVDGAPVSLMGTWEANLSGGGYQLDFHPNVQFSIIGPADGETASTPGVYTANGSINGSAAHNPFIAKSITFKLGSPGIDPNTTVTGVSFLYNTGLSNVVPGTPDPLQEISTVPEPATTGFGLAIIAACGAARRRRA
jgi:hypothetical protein